MENKLWATAALPTQTLAQWYIFKCQNRACVLKKVYTRVKSRSVLHLTEQLRSDSREKRAVPFYPFSNTPPTGELATPSQHSPLAHWVGHSHLPSNKDTHPGGQPNTLNLKCLPFLIRHIFTKCLFSARHSQGFCQAGTVCSEKPPEAQDHVPRRSRNWKSLWRLECRVGCQQDCMNLTQRVLQSLWLTAQSHQCGSSWNSEYQG